MPRSSDFMHSFYFMLEKIWYHHFTWSEPNSQEIVKFVPTAGPRGPELNCSKFTISCEFYPLQAKWWYHMFSSIKMEEYMQAELSGIFWVKMVAKNIMLGSQGTHFMHMRVNIYKHHHTETIFVFTIVASMSRLRSIYVVSMLSFIYNFIFITINRIISRVQTRLIFGNLLEYVLLFLHDKVYEERE